MVHEPEGWQGEVKKKRWYMYSKVEDFIHLEPWSCFLGSERKKFQDRRQNMSSGDGG